MHGPEVIILVVFILSVLFIGLPWLVFHYVTKWKSQASITTEDENLLDELHDLARRLDERMGTIERIIQADNPNWRAVAGDPVEAALEDRSERIYEAGRTTNRPARRN
jgi:phage shock protein B